MHRTILTFIPLVAAPLSALVLLQVPRAYSSQIDHLFR